MADWAFSSPDNHYLQNPPPAEVRNVESFGVRKWPEIDLKNPVLVLTKRVSSDVGGIIHVAEKTAVTRKTGERTAELKSEREKKEFLAKLVPTLKADSPIKQAIEKRTLKIHEVPGRDLFALSLDGRDVDYLYERGGKEYFDLTYSRWDKSRYYVFQDALKDFWLAEKLENGRYQLFKSNDRIQTFSPEYFSSILKAVDFLLWFSRFLRQISEELKAEGK